MNEYDANQAMQDRIERAKQRADGVDTCTDADGLWCACSGSEVLKLFKTLAWAAVIFGGAVMAGVVASRVLG